IGISGQRLISAMAIRALVTRRSPAGADCDHGKDQRATIRQHVGRFGQQGDGAGPESTRRFYEGEGCKNAQRDPQAALARDLAYVVMAMIMMMSMIMAWAGVSVFPTLPAWRLDGSVSMGDHADALLIGIPRSR
ncbi:MAG: hypothetical protein JWO52_591, partial [Gammaproteobacteria bacterium]|nr:hypothetical protein [Gammaproteobacteria bacterium]